jgi:hypothetical protein
MGADKNTRKMLPVNLCVVLNYRPNKKRFKTKAKKVSNLLNSEYLVLNDAHSND